MRRQLTEKEKRAVKNYNLPPLVEQKVWDVWSQDDKPIELNLVKTIVAQIISIVVAFGGSVALWVNYFVPDIAHMQGALNMIRFIFWIILPLTAIIKLFHAIVVNEDKNEALKKYSLDCWFQKSGLFPNIINLNKFVVVIGFVLNGYFISALMILVCFLVVFFTNSCVRLNVQKIMDKIVPTQNNDDVIEAEYTLM